MEFVRGIVRWRRWTRWRHGGGEGGEEGEEAGDGGGTGRTGGTGVIACTVSCGIQIWHFWASELIGDHTGCLGFRGGRDTRTYARRRHGLALPSPPSRVWYLVSVSPLSTSLGDADENRHFSCTSSVIPSSSSPFPSSLPHPRPPNQPFSSSTQHINNHSLLILLTTYPTTSPPSNTRPPALSARSLSRRPQRPDDFAAFLH